MGPAATVLLAAGGLAGVLVGASLDPGAGTALMVASSLLPPAVLGTALARTRTALGEQTRQRHRMAGQVAVRDEQLSRLGDRVEDLVDHAQDQVAETERARTRLRQARVELATSRSALAGVREQAVRARSVAEAAVAARDEARQVANAALARAEAAEAATRAARADAARAEAARADAARVDAARAADARALAVRGEAGRAEPSHAAARVEGRRSFASVDLRVFDAFVEADMADEDAVLDAPTRRGRHSAVPAVEPTTTSASAAGAGRDGGRRRASVLDVA